jgi:anti-sigma B factor antagonist
MSATTIGLDRQGSVAILRIAGDVTSGSEADLMDGFTRAVDGGAKAVVLDFAGMEYMNSGGIGLLVTLLVRAQRSGVRLLATGLSDHYHEILSLTRLDEAIAIHADEAAAVAAAEG